MHTGNMIFGLLLLLQTASLVASGLVGQCTDSSQCSDTSQFCDTAAGVCTDCTKYPCRPSVIAQQGEDMCKRQCPVYWKELESKKTSPSTDGTTIPIEVIPHHSKQIKDTGVATGLSTGKIILVVVMCAVVALVVVSIVIYKKKDRINNLFDEVFNRTRLPTQEHGVSAQPQPDNQNLLIQNNNNP